MALDNTTLKIITNKLKEELISSSFGKPLALGPYDYAFPYSEVLKDGNIRHGTFIFSLDSRNPFICYSLDRYEKIDDNSPFFNALKKLTNTTVVSVRKLEGERLITISLKSNPNDLLETNTGYDLIIELFPNHPNCYIISYPANKIMAVYHEHINIEKDIFITRNAPYIYPEPRGELPLGIEDIDQTRKYFSNYMFRYLSSYLERTGEKITDITDKIATSNKLYLKDKEILPYPFDFKDAKEIEVKDIYSAFVSDQKKMAKLEKEKELISLLEKAIKVARKKTINLNDDLAKAKDNLIYLEYGQIIYLYQGEINKGDKLLEKDGYSIPLDPRLSAPANANKYFKKYQKAKSAITILSSLIEKSKYESEYLEKKLLEAKDGTPRDILELKAELISQGYIKEKQIKGRIPKLGRRYSYQPHYIIFDNGKIGFGMNGLQNEELTFNQANKDDIFFHVLDYPGAHVILFGDHEDKNLRLTAMELALYLSHLDNGTVMIAKKKDVKKNSNHVGLVNVLKYETNVVKYIREESLKLFKKVLKE